ncbi:hypothetical protein [Pseudanabaena sp. PCC 6802]|nr:hypothetical protein [Pseudanabaena sp. PCC 6802]
MNYNTGFRLYGDRMFLPVGIATRILCQSKQDYWYVRVQSTISNASR